MLKDLEIRFLDAADVDRAYGFLSPKLGDLTEPDWRQYCGAVLRRPRLQLGQEDILIAANPPGDVFGVCILRQLRHRLYHRIVDVPILAIADVRGRNLISRALLERLIEIAQQRSCTSIRFWKLEADVWTRRSHLEEIQRSDIGLLMPLDLFG